MSEQTCGAKGNSSEAAVPRAKRNVSTPTESRSLEQSFRSSITAAIAVLKAKRRRSPLTLSMAQWVLRIRARSSPSAATGPASSATGAPGRGRPGARTRPGRQPPQPREEAVNAVHSLIRPVCVLVRGADEQDVAARRVRAHALHDRRGRDDIALGLAHLGAVLGDHALGE